MFTHKFMLFLPLAALALPACAAQETPTAPSQQGMVVVRDADTGELRAPTPAEAQALHPGTSASAAAAAAPAPKMVTGPGGRRSVKLGQRHMVYSVVTRGADGKLAEQCVHGADAAKHAAAHPASNKPEEHRHESR
ncbi:post-PEP-CTERM-1 domain-containing protein [Massilia sp. LjRoot122]|uniref:post-PEP-CTERM-1 domain-containing protein n=1 Tax=Massilia sp. LjRoot122 TaxID=3342257 RepID=UPI003ECCF8A5